MDQILEQIQALATAVTEQQRSQQELTISLGKLSAQMNEMQQLRQNIGDFQQPQVGHAEQQPLYVGQPTFAASKIKLDLPPKFDGKPSQMQGWTFQVEQYCACVGISCPATMVKLAVSRLEKDAFTWWRQLSMKGQEYQLGALCWSDFKDELSAAFADVDRELKLRRKLQSLHQQNSVANYTKEFRAVVLELGDQAPDDSALLFTYTEGLKPNVQMQVLLARPTLLVEAEQIAERADMAIFSANRRQSNQQQARPRFQPQRSQSNQPRNGPVPMELDNVKGNQQDHFPGRMNRSVICYRCGKPGHIRRDCRVRLPQDPSLHMFGGTLEEQGYAAEPECQQNRTWCKDNKLEIGAASQFEVKLADGQQVQVVGSIRKLVNLGPMTTALTFYVLDCQVPAILGIPFLATVNPKINWVRRTVSVVTSKGSEFLKVAIPSYGSAQCEMVSGKQYAKGLKREEYVYCGSLEYDESGFLNFTHRHAFGAAGGDMCLSNQLARDAMEDLKSKFPTVFKEPQFPIKRQNEELFQHVIRLKDEQAPPPRRKIYPLDSEELAELKKQISLFLESHRIRPSSSPYGAPILFAKKKDGGLRMCVDYRALNKNTVVDSYPLPRIDELLARMKGGRYFSKIDLRDAYHLLGIAPQDVHKTAFSCRYGTYEWLVMPFGLMNAPSTFQRVMNQIFLDLLDTCVVVYLDDILIFSRTEREHRLALDQVFGRLQQNKLFVKESKCALFLEQVEFLGHVVSADGIRAQPGKVKAVQDWPAPKNITELQQFLGLCNYYRRFIKGYAKIAAPLSNILRGKMRFEFGTEQLEAFSELKQALVSAPVLQVYDPTLPTRVLSDASGIAAGAVLEQQYGNVWNPVEYFSKRLNETEERYSATEREMLGCILSMQRWRPYLVGKSFDVLTDHCSNQYFRTQEKLSRRQARWLEVLADFDANFKYIPGRKHSAPDALSRIPTAMAIISVQDSVVLQKAIYNAQVATGDPEFTKLKDLVDKEGSGFSIRDGILVKLSGDKFLPVIPSDATELRDCILRELHSSPLGGHLGRRKLQKLVSERFFWPRMDLTVRKFCNECIVCQQAKVSTQSPIGLLQPLDPASRPFQQVTMDLITHFPVSQGFDAIFTVVDRFSKLVTFIPCETSSSAVDLAKLFYDRIVCRFGMPEKIISDRDARFLSTFWQTLMTLLGCKLGMSSGYHPQTDGQSERFHRSIESILRCYVAPTQGNWADILAQAEFALNSTVHAAHGKTPFSVVYGLEPTLPLDLAISKMSGVRVQAVHDFMAPRDQCFHDVKQALVKTNQSMCLQADKHRRDVTFTEGQFVYISTAHFPLSGALTRKLAPKWAGPYRICQVISSVAYKVDLPASYGRVHPVFHASQLRPHFGSIPSTPPPLFPTGNVDEPEYEVEDILDMRVSRGKSQYLVKWQGYPVYESTWEPESHLANAPDVVKSFLSRRGRRVSREGE